MNTIIGIDLGATNIKGGLVSNGRIVRSIALPTCASKGGEITMAVLMRVVEDLITSECEAIGLGVASVVDKKLGIAYDFTNIKGWDEVPLRDILETKFNLPVFIDNDANCFALSERYFGEGKEIDDFVGITLGTGVGGGIIVNGELISDAHCGSGEFGMLPYKDSILEDYCASRFFTHKYKMSGRELAERAARNDVFAMDAFHEYGTHVGELVKIIMYTLDPQAIILGGSIAKSFVHFEKGIRQSLTNYAYPRSIDSIILLATKIPESGILGAAAICMNTNHKKI